MKMIARRAMTTALLIFALMFLMISCTDMNDDTTQTTETEQITEQPTEAETLPVFADISMDAVVITPTADIYSTPAVDAENVISTVDELTTFSVSGEHELWYRVEYNGDEVYISKNTVADMTPTLDFSETEDRVIITTDTANIYAYPSAEIEAAKRGTVPKDTILNRIGIKDGWSRVQYTVTTEINDEEIEVVKEYYIENEYLAVYESKPDGTLPFVPDNPESIDNDWKAIWLSQFDLETIYRNDNVQREEADFRAKMTTVLDNVVNDGFNTVILQLRPNADSHYPSEVYPPSKYVVGSYENDFSYDPIQIIVDLCRERELKIHGWINPMRGMTDDEIKQIDDKFLIKQWYNDPSKNGSYITFVNQNWYLNPAYPEVRQLICDGASEILKKYALDGIHMDDYFYPTTSESFDAQAYAEYKNGGGNLDVLAWRRTNLDALVSELYATVKAYSLRALFGISPAGNINTVYNSHCADVYNWCAHPGYVDYIIPQVYFGFEHDTWDFVKTCNLWSNAIKTDYVDLIIGVSFGKALSGVDNYAGSGKDEWSKNKDILSRALVHSTTLKKCVGMTTYCYKYLYDPLTGTIVAGTQEEHLAYVETLKTITWHKENTIE